MPDITGAILCNRYRVDSFIGRGGMAEVYKVWDQKRGVFLAMKLLKGDLAEDKVFLRRFQREAQTLANLQHPNIVRFFGLEQEGLLAFILMEFIDGPSLRREIFDSGGPLSPQRISEIMNPLCAALTYAHGSGYVHCDIKPGNILIDSTGRLCISDFGIARMTEASTTTTMAAAGTPDYMSPEQIRGETPTPQMDIYALGVLLFELITGGERPFTGDQAHVTGSTGERVRWEHLNLAPPSPRSYNPAVSSELENVVLRCLDKDPARRFASAMDLAAALDQALGGMNTGSLSQSPAVPPAGIPPAGGGSSTGFASQTPHVPAARPKAWMWVGGAILIVAVLAVILMSGTRVPGGAPPPLNTPINTLSPAITATLLSFSTPTLTLVPLPSVTPTETQTSTPTVQACSSSLTCDSIGSYCQSPKDKMILACVPAGEFLQGSNASDAFPNEKPMHKVTVAAYWIDQTEVTNAMFSKFVQETGYITTYERTGTGWVFYPPTTWNQVSGADWKHPMGGGSTINGLENHPVVQIQWEDANAYCAWAGRALPTEAQWEKAARGVDGRKFPWGNNPVAGDLLNLADQSFDPGYGEPFNDGYRYTAPVGSFPKGESPYHVYDMSGNVTEFTRDLIDGGYAVRGGSFVDVTSPIQSLSATRRFGDKVGNFAIGFRCEQDAK
jgi:serine/threonine protein kinase